MYGTSMSIFKVHVKQSRHTYHSASACRILSKSDNPRQSYDVISIFKNGGHRNSTSGFGLREFAHLGGSTSTCIRNFGEISQSTAEILLLPISEKKTSDMLELPVPIFTFAHHRMSLCICLPNFVQI